MTAPTPPELVLGPVLRHIGPTDATIWVETSRPCLVDILGHTERTWSIAGHHYALVIVTGLEPGTRNEYEVRLDDRPVWPLPDAPGPSVLRPPAAGDDVELVFGSCRFATRLSAGHLQHYGTDALDAYAIRMMNTDSARWPTALLMLGDQVYADHLSPATEERIRARRADGHHGPDDQVLDYEEYSWLYLESWSDPEVRWLLSNLPASMIFDDHDVHDDWNTSESWRAEMARLPWWPERIASGLMSYWVYQHLGNLGPAELANDDIYQRIRGHHDDATPILREFAEAADRETDGIKPARWSYARDLGRSRLVVIDSRCGRILANGARKMVSDAEFDWIAAQTNGDYDHLLLGTSVPWLLPNALSTLEASSERLARGSRGPSAARLAEKARCRADLEHWAAFENSFDRLAALIAEVGSGSRGQAPASICVLSGDVHHGYTASTTWQTPLSAKVFQLTCSPMHNYIPGVMRAIFRFSWSAAGRSLARVLFGRQPERALTWERMDGPLFGNLVGTLRIRGRSADILIEQAQPATDHTRLAAVVDRPLVAGPSHDV